MIRKATRVSILTFMWGKREKNRRKELKNLLCNNPLRHDENQELFCV
jgi:hypothetical protein